MMNCGRQKQVRLCSNDNYFCVVRLILFYLFMFGLSRKQGANRPFFLIQIFARFTASWGLLNAMFLLN